MEVVEVLVGIGWFVLVCFCSAVGGFVAKLFVERRRIIELEGLTGQTQARLDSLENSIKGRQSRENSAVNQEKMLGALVDGLTLMRAGKPPLEIMAEVGAKYPELAPVLMKKAGIKL